MCTCIAVFIAPYKYITLLEVSTNVYEDCDKPAFIEINAVKTLFQ